MTKTLATQESQPLALQPESPVDLMIQTAIDKGISPEGLEKLVDLKERIEKRNDEKAFNAAFCKLQKDLPVIVAQTEIKNRGKYEKFEDVMKQVQPHLSANGFSVSFTNTNTDGRVTETCHLMHERGHSRSNSFTVRVSKLADSETQADCKAATTAKRNALLNALNIVIRQDYLQDEDECHNEGGDELVTPKEAADLKDWVEATGSDVAEFLRYAKADSFDNIRQASLPKLHAALRLKEEMNKKEGK